MRADDPLESIIWVEQATDLFVLLPVGWVDIELSDDGAR